MYRSRFIITSIAIFMLFFGLNQWAETRVLKAQESAPTESLEATGASSIVVTSKNYSEQLILGQMLIALLEDTGYAVTDKTGLGNSTAVRSAIEAGEVDLYIELTGSALSVYHSLPSSALPTDAMTAHALAKSLDAPLGITWLDPGSFNNTFAMMVTDDLLAKGIDSLDALAVYMSANDSPLSICVESDFYGREQDGLLGMQTQYDFAFKPENVLLSDLDGVYEGLRNGDCDIAEGYATDGRIPAWGFTTLVDSLAFFPFYNPAPVVRQEVLEQYPELAPLLNSVSALLDDDTMRQLNARVDIGADNLFGSGDEETPEDVARSFLSDKGLIKPPPIVISSKNYSEQLILGQILIRLLQESGYDVVDKTGIGASRTIRAAMENEAIDLYMELTGSALSVYNKLPAEALPTTAERSYELARSLDLGRGITWLDPGPFNNTYAIMTTERLASEGIDSLTTLADYMNSNDSPLTICVESDFYGREQDGLVAMQQHYGFEFNTEDIILTDFDGLYSSLNDGSCDLAEGYATDGRISAWDFIVLEDTLSFFPFYNPAPVIRTDVLEIHPGLSDLLNALSPLLDDKTMRRLNERVDIGEDSRFGSGDEETPAEVAESFLLEVGFIKPLPIVVSSKPYTEQLILGKILVNRLESAGYDVEDKTGIGSSLTIRDAIENGEIDLYYELTGSALSLYNKLPSAALPTDPDRAYLLAKSLDAERGLIWLDRGAFNNTYAIMTTDPLIDSGIDSLDILAKYMNENDAPYSLCVENDFYSRSQDGLPAMEQVYGFSFDPEKITLTDLDGVYDALRNGECDFAEGYSTDGRIAAWGFTNLIDSRSFFPIYNPAPVVRAEVLEIHPELEEILQPVTALLDDKTITSLNARVDIGADSSFGSGDEETPDQVAKSFLIDAGLMEAELASTEETDAEKTDAEESSAAETDAGEGESSASESNPGNTGVTNVPSADVTPTPAVTATLEISATETVIPEEIVSTATISTATVSTATVSTATVSTAMPITETVTVSTTAPARAATPAVSTTATEDAPEINAEPTTAENNVDEVMLEVTGTVTSTGVITSVMTSVDIAEVEATTTSTITLAATRTPTEVPAAMPETAPTPSATPAVTPAATPATENSSVETFVVASQEATVDHLLAQFLILLLTDLGYAVEEKSGFSDSNTLRMALTAGEIDFYPERTSTTLTEYHGLPLDTLPTNAQEAFALALELDARNDITWLTNGAIEEQHALVVSDQLAEQGISTIEELASLMNDSTPDLGVCVDTAFFTERNTGLYGLQSAYEFRFYTVNVVLLPNNEMLDGLHNGLCDVAYGINTDSRLTAWDLTVLEDTRDFFVAQALAPIGSTQRLAMIDGLDEKVATLEGLLTTDILGELGRQVEFGEDGEIESEDEAMVAAVAASFLCENELISNCDE